MRSAAGFTGLVGALVIGVFAAMSASAASTATLEGQVVLGLPGVSVEGFRPIVVFLTPLDGEAMPMEKGMEIPPPVEIRQKDARFSPAFRAIVRGQTIVMPNDDVIYHNVFSYSRPNDFDLGMYPVGESRSLTLEHPGVVKAYCSIHETMNATIFVAPNPYFAVVRPDGRFLVENVPPGAYRLETWSEKLPSTQREVRLEAGKTLVSEIPIS